MRHDTSTCCIGFYTVQTPHASWLKTKLQESFCKIDTNSVDPGTGYETNPWAGARGALNHTCPRISFSHPLHGITIKPQTLGCLLYRMRPLLSKCLEYAGVRYGNRVQHSAACVWHSAQPQR